MIFSDLCDYPVDELTTLIVTLPDEAVEAIDEAIDGLFPALKVEDRGRFIYYAVQYALESIQEEQRS